MTPVPLRSYGETVSLSAIYLRDSFLTLPMTAIVKSVEECSIADERDVVDVARTLESEMSGRKSSGHKALRCCYSLSYGGLPGKIHDHCRRE